MVITKKFELWAFIVLPTLIPLAWILHVGQNLVLADPFKQVSYVYIQVKYIKLRSIDKIWSRQLVIE